MLKEPTHGPFYQMSALIHSRSRYQRVMPLSQPRYGRYRPKADNGNEDQFKSSIVVIKFCLLSALKRLALWRQDKNEKPTNKRKPAL